MHTIPLFDQIAYLTALNKFQVDKRTEEQAALSYVNDANNGSLNQRKSGVGYQRPQKIQCDWTQWTRLYYKRAFHTSASKSWFRYSDIAQAILLPGFK